MVGLTNNRSIQDEKLIEAIFQSHLSPESAFVPPIGETSRPRTAAVYGATATNLIIDARPTANAMVMSVKGAGTENMDYYKDGKKLYLGVDNIHVMRESLSKVADALRDADQLAAVHGKEEGATFLDRQALRRSGWLKHISAILEGTLIIVKNIHINSSHVLIHCSDGWDRTAQLSSLSQLCLDPFYRTIRGFQVLVEKDWLAYGHRFADRCGHLSSEKFFTTAAGDQVGGGGADAAAAFLASMQNKFTPQSHVKETSPVFHQFLECVQQMQRQHPTRFEFNEEYLQRLHYHLYSCQFGTFLWNNERERRLPEGQAGVPCERTYSVWDFLNSASEASKFRNLEYDASLDDRNSRAVDADMGVLAIDPKDVKFWHELYGRTDEEMNGRLMPSQTTGPELVGPIDSDDVDPVRERAQAFAETALPHGAAMHPSSSPSPAPIAVPERLLDDSYLRLHSPPFLPTADGSNSDSVLSSTGVPGRSHTLRGVDPRPSPNSGSALSPQRRPLSSDPTSPDRRTAVSLADERVPLPVPNFKNMWASFSSNANAALTAVQGAYEGATKDLRVQDSIGGFSARFTNTSPGFGSLNAGGEMEEKSSLSSASASGGGRGWGDELEDRSPWAGMTTRQARSELSENPWATSDASTMRDYPSKPAAVRSSGSVTQSWSSETSAPLDPSSARRSTLESSYLDPTLETLAGLSLTPKTASKVAAGAQKPSSSISSLSPTAVADSPAASNVAPDSDPLGVGFLR